VTDADQQHVSYLRWGDHRGVKYKNSTIRGTELKREEFVLTIKPKPPGGPGPGLNLGLQWQPNREHRFVFWMSRTIDRVVDGVIWRSFDSRPCTEQGGYYVSLDQAAERLVSAIGLASGREGALPTFVGNEFLGVLTAARRLKNPAFSVSTEQSDWIVALKDADKPDDVVRRVRIGTENGRMKYRGDA
jgi:hypothetical protein